MQSWGEKSVSSEKKGNPDFLVRILTIFAFLRGGRQAELRKHDTKKTQLCGLLWHILHSRPLSSSEEFILSLVKILNECGGVKN